MDHPGRLGRGRARPGSSRRGTPSARRSGTWTGRAPRIRPGPAGPGPARRGRARRAARRPRPRAAPPARPRSWRPGRSPRRAPPAPSAGPRSLSSASSASSTLNTYRNGLAVSSWRSRRSARSIPAAAAPANSVVPPSSTCCAATAASATRSRSASLPDFRLLGEPRHGLLQRLQVGQDQLGRDRLDVALRRDVAVDVAHVGVGEDPHDLADRVGLADVGEELVAEALALRRAADQPGDVHEPDRGRARSWPSRTARPARRSRGSGMPTMPTLGSMVANG